MERSTAEVLKAAREKIAEPEAWTKGAYALDATCHSVRSDDPTARTWCAAGAIFSVHGQGEPYAALMRAIGLQDEVASGFNDDPTTTHADVLAMFDKAIALAEQEQA